MNLVGATTCLTLTDMEVDTVGRLIKGDETIHQVLSNQIERGYQFNQDLQEYEAAAQAISDTLPLAFSIDNYLDNHRGNEKIELCGKLAISKAILLAEGKSLLRYRPEIGTIKINLKSLKKTWYAPFFKLITENCTFSELARRLREVAIVSFNYDRCLEHFLYHALAQLYHNTPRDDIAAALSQLEVHHPYGAVGPLPYADNTNGISFGQDVKPEKLLEIARTIKTFTESEDSNVIERIRNLFSPENKIVFLGFAYHTLNLKLLSTIVNTKQVGRYLGTAHGVSDENQNAISIELKAHFGSLTEIDFAPSTCNQLFYDYWKSLSFPHARSE